MNVRPTSLPRRRLRLALAGLTATTTLFVAACSETPQSTFLLRSDFAWDIQWLFVAIMVAAVAVFIVVEGALLWAAIRYRARRGDRSVPKQIHGNTRLEIGWTALPAVVLAFVLVPSTATIFKTQAAAPPDALQVHVIGHQFWWEFEYPDLGVRTANELHMPVDRTLNLRLNSADVIHSFWIPALGGKRDVVPNHTNHLWWTPNETGMYPGQCAELCGYSHANMRTRGFVQTPAEFDAWVQRQRMPAATPPEGSEAARGAQVFQQRGCGGCHTVSGTSAQARIGPDLTHIGSRTSIASAIFDNTPENMRAWLKDPPAVKPGSLMPNLNLNDSELTALVAYLQSLQ